MPITEEQLNTWRTDGYVVVPDFLTPAEIDAVLADVARYRPTWDEFAAARPRYEDLVRNPIGFVEFPYGGDALNDVTVHRDLMDFAQRVLGTTGIALATSLLWAKYAGTHDFEQSLHADYRNNTLVHPRDDGIYTQIPFIVYLTDVDLTMGPTYAVSRRHTDGESVVKNRRPRDTHPDLYDHEEALTVGAGTLLIYTMGTFHRGSAITAETGRRVSLHMVYRSAACQWMGWRAWARYAATPEMARFITRATPEQRSLIGFPAPGHDYWTEDMIEGVAGRYPDIDMEPYRLAIENQDPTAQTSA